ncbi:putative serine/threonine-protein kinase, partial [Tetrabaena socialis]
VCDFGLARVLGADATHVSTRPHGTTTHNAPEVWAEGHVSQQSDMWAYGMTLWELATGERPWRGMSAGRIMHAVMLRGLRPTVPDWLPAGYAQLMGRCWAQ